MKISGSPIGGPALGALKETAAVDPAAPSAAPAQSGGDLPTGTLQQAKAALDALPEIDQARVAALRDALAKGELPFDAARLAGLIDRYHGSRS
jgi:negative regulator of flagellin synthesis FlgM